MSGRSNTASSFLDPSFVTACLVLGLAAFVVGPRIYAKGGTDVKDPLPLKRPLREMDKNGVAPYRFMNHVPLPDTVEAALGADDYIHWQFEDMSVERIKDPLRFVQLFVTYYTGGRDLVPHTPDRCMIGAGYTAKVKGTEQPELPTVGQAVPLRVLTFEKSEIHNREQPTVIYTFHCNGDFVCSRNDVRFRINSRDRFAYFCKIEISFGTKRSQPLNPTREDSIAAAAKFLDTVLPVLLSDHLPDWQAANLSEHGAAEDVS